MTTPSPQKFDLCKTFRWIYALLAGLFLVLPCGASAAEAVDHRRINVQSCVSDEEREATAQKYQNAVDVPQHPRQFLSNLKEGLTNLRIYANRKTV